MKSRTRRSKRTDWLHHEKILWQEGYLHVAGTDEVGRGPLAGPVVAAAVIFPEQVKIPGINDSKKLSLAKRLLLFDLIQEKALATGIAFVSSAEIDHYNILNASLLAMKQAVSNLKVRPDFVLVDGREKIPQLEIPQKPVIKGDSLSQSIASASILAKVTRDNLMQQLDQEYPQFGFLHNQGYATQAHKQALEKFGPSPVHRVSFSPVSKALLKAKEAGLKLG